MWFLYSQFESTWIRLTSKQQLEKNWSIRKNLNFLFSWTNAEIFFSKNNHREHSLFIGFIYFYRVSGKPESVFSLTWIGSSLPSAKYFKSEISPFLEFTKINFKVWLYLYYKKEKNLPVRSTVTIRDHSDICDPMKKSARKAMSTSAKLENFKF